MGHEKWDQFSNVISQGSLKWPKMEVFGLVVENGNTNVALGYQ